MQSSMRVGFLLLVAIVSLAGCDAPRDNGTDVSSRVRLDTSKADAQFGEYVVRVSGLLTSDLTPEIAQTYGIVRSESRGFVNLVLLRRGYGNRRRSASQGQRYFVGVKPERSAKEHGD